MKKRGRPRQFDEEAVIKAMTSLFWRQGFAATSLDDIAVATGLNRPSLYRVFGNKVEMYVTCLDLFAERMTQLSEDAFAGADTLEAGLSGFYLGLLDVYYSGSDEAGGLGCLVFSNAVTEAPSHEAIQNAVATGLEWVRTVLRANIVRHRPEQDETAIDMAADVAVSAFLGLGVQVRSGKDRRDVERTVRNTVAAIAKLL